MAISSLIVRGDKSISQRLSTIARRTAVEKIQVLEKIARPRLRTMQARTPVDRGWLRDSGRLDMAHSGNAAVAQFTFGGGRVDYAVYVHENLTARHPAGQAKFVESVLNEDRQAMAFEIASEFHRLIAG